MTKYEVNMTYEPFAKEPEYIEANRAFIRTMDLASSWLILDLACGIGTMADLILEFRPQVKIIGLDLSHESLRLTQMSGTNGLNLLLQGTAYFLPLKGGSVDTVIMGNSIHLLAEPDKLLQEVRRVLRPEGLFAFNGSFYAGTFAPNTEPFYHEWVKLAILYLMNKDRLLRQNGQPGIPRKRGTVSGAFSHRWPSPQEWVETLRTHGFKVQSVYERTVLMRQRSFETIGAYGGFAKIILSGYPVHEASEALQATAGEALAALKMEQVPRFWLEIVARRQGELPRQN